MTVIIGWKCSNGVVMGADSAATLGVLGEKTVQEMVSKLAIVKDKLILGVSGPISLAQRYQGHLENMPTGGFNSLTTSAIHSAMTQLSGIFWGYTKDEYERAGLVSQAIGNRAPLVHALHHTLVAVRIHGEDRLIQFSETCAPEEATADLPYVSIGSGQRNADPFLAFLRNLFWKGAIPTLDGGIFATLWTLRECIRSSPGGVGGPPKLALLEHGNARMLEDDDLQEHEGAIEEARRTLGRFREDLEPPPAGG